MRYFSLNHKVCITVPSTQGIADKITAAEHKARAGIVAGKLSDLFGGATSYKAGGYYRADDGRLIVETVYKVEAYTSDTDLEKNQQDLFTYADQLRREYQQESLLLEIDGVAMFIE